jgi:hypothetical protein
VSQNHYSTKCKRRPRNKRRKDYTRDTMLRMRDVHTRLLVSMREEEIAKGLKGEQ